MQIQYTLEMIDELKKCMEEPVYFIGKYIIFIDDKTGLDINYKEKHFDTIRALHNKNTAVLCTSNIPNQIVASYFLWCGLFKYDQTFLYMSKNLVKSGNFMKHIKNMYKKLPDFVKCRTTQNSYNSIRFDNGCRIFVCAATSNSTRGLTLQLVYVDDYTSKEDKSNGLHTSIFPSVIQPGGKVIYNN